MIDSLIFLPTKIWSPNSMLIDVVVMLEYKKERFFFEGAFYGLLAD